VQPTIDAKDAIFIDETGCHPGMGPTRGWAPLGERLLGPESAYSGGRRLSLVAAMDVRGIRRHAIIDGGVKGADFLDFIHRVLGPSLRPGKVVVMDNLQLHKNPEVIQFLKARGCRVVFVPPYSPDTNPIELAFSKMKHLVRKAAARCRLSLRSAFDAACAAITPRDARNYINHAGYW
jgi:transposase